MEPKFEPGISVRVLVDDPPGHIRTPGYIQGKTGLVTAVRGEYRNPESLAHGGDGLPRKFLYLVSFDQRQVWPTTTAAPQDKLLLEIYEHWLEPA
jgi:nitrile hydratase